MGLATRGLATWVLCALVRSSPARRPTPSVYSRWSNGTSLTDIVEANGSLTWPIINTQSNFSVLPGVVPQEALLAMLDALPPRFDTDMDTVDDMASYEFYIESSDGAAAKVRDAARESHRQKLLRITTHLTQRSLLPYVNARFDACGGACVVCHSLIRRYLRDERRSHDMHFDIQALVT